MRVGRQEDLYRAEQSKDTDQEYGSASMGVSMQPGLRPWPQEHPGVGAACTSFSKTDIVGPEDNDCRGAHRQALLVPQAADSVS